MSKLRSLLGPTYALKSLNYDSQRCLNFYPEFDEMGTGKEQEPISLVSVPGYGLQFNLPRSPLRGMWRTANNYIYAVAGNGLYQCIPTVTNRVITWTHALLAYLTTSTGYVSMVDGVPNQYLGTANTGLINQVVLVDGSTTGFVWQEGTTNIYTITPATGYAGSNFVTFQDGIFVFSQPGSISGFFAPDPLQINDLNVIENNLNPDIITRIISDHDILWIFGTRSLSVWQNTGGSQTTNVFQQIPGASSPTGCNSPWTILQTGGELLWVSNDDRGYAEVAMAFQYRPIRISNHAVELWLNSLGDLSLLSAWTYQSQGHTFYILNHPNAATTWAFDTHHKMWHERAYFSNGQYSRDLINFHINPSVEGYGNIHLVGDFQNGNVYSLDEDNYTHNGQPIRRERDTPHQSGALERVFYSQLQLDIEAGTGLDGQGYPIQVGTTTPTTQQATNVLLQGNGPIYTLPFTPSGPVTVTSTGNPAYWSNSYSVSGNQVTINNANFTSSALTLGTGNGTNKVFNVPNIYNGATSAQIYLNDWRGNNLQFQAPSQNLNLCAASYNFNISWTLNDVTVTPGLWSVPDGTSNGSYIYEDSVYTTHFMTIPYTSTAGQVTNLSLYVNAGSNSSSDTKSGGTASFTTASSPYTQYYMTLQTAPTSGSIEIGDVISAAGLSTPQTLVQLLSGTINTVGSQYLCYPGWTGGNIATEAFTGVNSTKRYLLVILGAGQHYPSMAIFDTIAGSVVLTANCTPSINLVSGTTYRISISFTETGSLNTPLVTDNAVCSFATNQMTLLQAPNWGTVKIGSTVINAGVSTGTTVVSLVSGSLNQAGSVYTLSSTPGTVAASTTTFSDPLPTSTQAIVALSNRITTSWIIPPAYPGRPDAYIPIWGCQIGTNGLQPLVETNGATAYEQVTYTPSSGVVNFVIAPPGATGSIPASTVTGIFSVTAPQLVPTEYQATFTYQAGNPIYEYIGTDPQIGLSYSSDGGHTYSNERLVPIGKIGDRYKRLIWRKLGMDRDRVWKFTCSDPVKLTLIGAEIDAKRGEASRQE